MRFLLFASLVTSALAIDSLAELMDKLPKCSIECLTSALSEQGCSLTDVQCACSNVQAIVESASPCLIIAGCDLDELSSMFSPQHSLPDIHTAMANSLPRRSVILCCRHLLRSNHRHPYPRGTVIPNFLHRRHRRDERPAFRVPPGIRVDGSTRRSSSGSSMIDALKVRISKRGTDCTTLHLKGVVLGLVIIITRGSGRVVLFLLSLYYQGERLGGSEHTKMVYTSMISNPIIQSRFTPISQSSPGHTLPVERIFGIPVPSKTPIPETSRPSRSLISL